MLKLSLAWRKSLSFCLSASTILPADTFTILELQNPSRVTKKIAGILISIL